MILVSLIFSFKLTFSLSSFTLIKRLISLSSFLAMRVLSCSYLRLSMFPQGILIPVCNSFSPVFLLMCSGYRLDKQGNNRQPCCNPFSILTVLTIASWPTDRFLRRQVIWSGILISWRIFYSLLWSTQSKALAWSMKQKQMFFWNSLAFSFFQHPLDVGNLVSGSPAFPKSSLNIWKFMVHILLKPHLENFKYYFVSLWDECNCAVCRSHMPRDN